MRIFVAGATGAIGRPLVAQLIAHGHEVFALTRSEERAREVEQLGIVPIVANVLCEEELLRGVEEAQPEVVVEMLTALPKVYTPQAMERSAAWNTRLRLEGGGNLQRAAEAAGAGRYIVQSAAFWYAPGEGLATEESPFALEGPPGIAQGSKTYAQIERRVLGSERLAGVALRFGFFYGPGTWFAVDGSFAEQVRRQQQFIVGEGQGVWNFVHVEDAASSIVSILEGPAGVYNITDDTPTELGEFLPAYARWLGAPYPPTRSATEELRTCGEDRLYYATRLRGASNAKSKRHLRLTFRTQEWLEGTAG